MNDVTKAAERLTKCYSVGVAGSVAVNPHEVREVARAYMSHEESLATANATINQLRSERNLMAKLAKGEQFYNPMHAMEAIKVRDRILEEAKQQH